MKRRKAYEKPSERKTREKAEAVRRARKAARKLAQREGLIPLPKRRESAPRWARLPRSFWFAAKHVPYFVRDAIMALRSRCAPSQRDHQMGTITRQSTTTITMPSAPEESVPEPVTQRKRVGRFRLQVDRQMKNSYATYEAAEKVGPGIKKEHPILQVAVYDGVEGVNKIIELP